MYAAILFGSNSTTDNGTRYYVESGAPFCKASESQSLELRNIDFLNPLHKYNAHRSASHRKTIGKSPQKSEHCHDAAASLSKGMQNQR